MARARARHQTRLRAGDQRGRGSVDEYLAQTAIANPHVTIHYIDPEGEQHDYQRAADKLPPEPKEILPHPYGIELGNLVTMLQATKGTTLSQFLTTSFSRVSTSKAAEICETAKLSTRANPGRIGRNDARQRGAELVALVDQHAALGERQLRQRFADVLLCLALPGDARRRRRAPGRRGRPPGAAGAPAPRRLPGHRHHRIRRGGAARLRELGLHQRRPGADGALQGERPLASPVQLQAPLLLPGPGPGRRRGRRPAGGRRARGHALHGEGLRALPGIGPYTAAAIGAIAFGIPGSGSMALLLANVRTPREREGDFTAQIASSRLGQRRLGRAIARRSRSSGPAAAASRSSRVPGQRRHGCRPARGGRIDGVLGRLAAARSRQSLRSLATRSRTLCGTAHAQDEYHRPA